MTDLSVTTSLQPGRPLRMAVDKGFLLIVAEGTVSVASPPPWFGDAPFVTRSKLSEGDAYVAEHGGWIEISAPSYAQVRGIPRPASAEPASHSSVASLLQWLGRSAS